MTESLALAELPLFPLGTVLYPGGLLSLRIFEVRYLDMVRKCYQGKLPFGVVALSRGSEIQRPAGGPGAEAFASEAFQAVGTLATITEFSAPQPGLMVIRCTGTRRFKVTRSDKRKHGLWVADAVCLPADASVEVPPYLQPVSDALGKLIHSLQERGVTAQQMPIAQPYLLQDCAWVANRWCELLALTLERQQQLMALDNPLVRLELVGDMLEHSGIGL